MRDSRRKRPRGLGTRLRERRLEIGATLDEVAAATKVSKGNLSLIENGLVDPSATTLWRVCSQLETTSDWLIGGASDWPSRTLARRKRVPVATEPPKE